MIFSVTYVLDGIKKVNGLDDQSGSSIKEPINGQDNPVPP